MLYQKSREMKQFSKYTIFLLASLLLCSSSVMAGGKHRSRMKLFYKKQADQTKVLESQLLVKTSNGYEPLIGANLNFYALTDSTESLLGEVATDTYGKAKLLIDPNYSLPLNSNFAYVFRVEFSGNDTCKKASKEKEIRDVQMALTFSEDSTISVRLSEQDTIFAADEMVSFFVERLYSYLPLYEDVTDNSGELSYKFPSDIPGDSSGTVNVVVKIIDSDNYGTVIQSSKVKWGIPVNYDNEMPRALWSDQAPLWMLIAVFIVLLGAFINFLIAVYQLYQIRKLAKNDL